MQTGIEAEEVLRPLQDVFDAMEDDGLFGDGPTDVQPGPIPAVHQPFMVEWPGGERRAWGVPATQGEPVGPMFPPSHFTQNVPQAVQPVPISIGTPRDQDVVQKLPITYTVRPDHVHAHAPDAAEAPWTSAPQRTTDNTATRATANETGPSHGGGAQVPGVSGGEPVSGQGGHGFPQ